MTRSEGGVTALFPFQRLSHSFIMGDFGGRKFNPHKEKESNNNVRKLLNNIINRIESFIDPQNENAKNKSQHYIKAIKTQLAICDKSDEVIDKITTTYSKRLLT